MTNINERYVDHLDFSGLTWKRPECPTRVWRIVEGRRKTADGKMPRFSIQEVPAELEDDVIDFMVTNFLDEEPVNVDKGTKDDPVAVREFRTLWRDTFRQGISVVALTVDPDPSVKPVIVGANMLCVLTSDDAAVFENLTLFRSESLQKSMRTSLKLMDEADVMGKYNVDKYMTASGLCVHRSFRGQGLGEELLRARDDIGLAYQIPATETIFTATVSQILASRVGFEVLLERKYSELLDENGKVAYLLSLPGGRSKEF